MQDSSCRCKSKGAVRAQKSHTTEISSPESWAACDAGNPVSYQIGAFDGRYVYYVPYANSVVARYDTQGDFRAPESWAAYDAGGTSDLKTVGYDGAAFDGRYIYFIPFWEGDDTCRGFHARLLRYDTLGDFAQPASWEAADGGAYTSPPNPGGFNGGAFDGRYLYFSPWREDGEGGGVGQCQKKSLREIPIRDRAGF